MKPLLIGLTAKAEHGKSYASHVIKQRVEAHGTSLAGIFEISEVIRLWCVARNQLPASVKRADMTPAQIKVLVEASDFIKNTEGTTYWMNEVMKWIEETPVDVAIIPNLRRPTEAQMVLQHGGTVWRINRLNQDGTPFVSPTRDPNHELETGLDNWAADFFLYNLTGKPALFEKTVATTFDHLMTMEMEALSL